MGPHVGGERILAYYSLYALLCLLYLHLEILRREERSAWVQQLQGEQEPGKISAP